MVRVQVLLSFLLMSVQDLGPGLVQSTSDGSLGDHDSPRVMDDDDHNQIRATTMMEDLG
jgi:hypothetical protein